MRKKLIFASYCSTSRHRFSNYDLLLSPFRLHWSNSAPSCTMLNRGPNQPLFSLPFTQNLHSRRRMAVSHSIIVLFAPCWYLGCLLASLPYCGSNSAGPPPWLATSVAHKAQLAHKRTTFSHLLYQHLHESCVLSQGPCHSPYWPSVSPLSPFPARALFISSLPLSWRNQATCSQLAGVVPRCHRCRLLHLRSPCLPPRLAPALPRFRILAGQLHRPVVGSLCRSVYGLVRCFLPSRPSGQSRRLSSALLVGRRHCCCRVVLVE